MEGKTIQILRPGDRASFSKTISEYDVYAFAGITGDFNPLHVNEAYAVRSRFKGRIVHGALLCGLISAVIGMYLPGEGALYEAQSLRFLRPVIELIPERNRIRLATRCWNQRGERVAEGESVVLPKQVRSEERP
jgi:3-hydroxybutyryl-CoA dehydratase